MARPAEPAGADARRGQPAPLGLRRADDPRLTIEPDIPVVVTAADYFARRDPPLEAALAGE